LRGACGYDGEQAVKLAVAAPELLMLHPDNVNQSINYTFF
jgi:sRNA-binding carbon storage regulator CsrA